MQGRFTQRRPSMPSMPITLLRSFLNERLRQPLPGTEAQLRMAPEYRMKPEDAQIEGKDCLEAAVLALFFPADNHLQLVLTRRRADLTDHAGQVSFPGGRREPEEPLSQTALREAHEEIGVHPSLIELHGRLSPLYIPPTGFCVFPFVGTAAEPLQLTPDRREVAEIMTAPLPTLLDESICKREPWDLNGARVQVPYFDISGCKVWGATAMMLAELVEITREAPDISRLVG